MLNKEFLKIAGVPLLLALLFTVFVLLYNLLNLPSREEIINFFKGYYDQYGYWLVFVGALIEGTLLINWYLPGSIVIVLGVVFSYPDPFKAALMVTLVILGFFISAILNYLLGKFGWYRLLLKFGLRNSLDNMKQKVEKKGMAIILSTYIHPNLGALTATSAGILKLSFGKFALYSLLALTGWNIIWGLIAYTVGEKFLNYLGFHIIIISLFFWITILAIKHVKNKDKPEHISVP